MEYSLNEQESLDLQWHLVDTEGNIAFCLSAGGKLPSSVASSIEDNELLVRYFESLPEITQGRMSPHLRKYALVQPNMTEFPPDSVDAVLSSRGLFGYDKTVSGNMGHPQYHLTVIPGIPLKVDQLPNNIREMLSRTRLNYRFMETYEFNVDEVE